LSAAVKWLFLVKINWIEQLFLHEEDDFSIKVLIANFPDTKPHKSIFSKLLCFVFFRYFTEGLQTIEHFGTYVDDLTNKLADIRRDQTEEKRDLEEVKTLLKNSTGFNKAVSTNSKSYEQKQSVNKSERETA
jgi:hypothetical protein